jgi:hypothetical protein
VHTSPSTTKWRNKENAEGKKKRKRESEIQNKRILNERNTHGNAKWKNKAIKDETKKGKYLYNCLFKDANN